MRASLKVIACVGLAFIASGCIVASPQPVAGQPAEDAPVIDGPGVLVIQQEPPPVERVYVYDPGFPPGTYYYNGYYYYGGYRYERDVFVTRYVNVNVREGRFRDPAENRSRAREIEATHQREYARTGGVRAAHNSTPARQSSPNENDHRAARDMTPHPNGEHVQRNAANGQVQPGQHPQPEPRSTHPPGGPKQQREQPEQQGGRNRQE